jgi:hypothetical protein
VKVEITHHAGKGSQLILPSKGAVNQLVKDPQTSVVKYAKAGPDVVQNGPSIVGEET